MQARNNDELRDDCGELLEQSENTALLTVSLQLVLKCYFFECIMCNWKVLEKLITKLHLTIRAL